MQALALKAPPLRIVHDERRALVRIFADGEHPVLEYSALTGDVRITGRVRALELDTPERGLRLSSRGDIHLNAEGMVRLRGKAGVRIEAAGADCAPVSAVDVGPAGVTVAGHRLGVAAAEGCVRMRRCDVSGDELRATWKVATWAAERLEIAARDMRTKAASLVQSVEQTLTTRAGRLREWVLGTRHSRAGSTEILADEEVRIDGAKIHLG
jgi:hypothetical protein